MSVACDDGSFSSPKSSQEGVAFPFGRRTRFQTEFQRNEVRSISTTRYAYNSLRFTMFRSSLYKQRDSWAVTPNVNKLLWKQ